MNLYESSEDYLERILVLNEQKGNVRSIDIAESMGFSKPSVSIAMKKLKENGFIVVDDNGSITLTEKGLQVAGKTYEKHKIISKFLMKIGVSKENALADACKIEHVLSDESFAALKKFTND